MSIEKAFAKITEAEIISLPTRASEPDADTIMEADWGTRLVELARGVIPPQRGVTHVTTRNPNAGYVLEVPVVTVVTPVTPLEGSFQKDPETNGVTIGVTVADEVAERVAVMEIDGGLPRDIAVAVAIFERILPSKMMDTLARFADEQVIRVQKKGGRATVGAVNSRSLQDNYK